MKIEPRDLIYFLFNDANSPQYRRWFTEVWHVDVGKVESFDGAIRFPFRVGSEACNQGRTLHGGAAAAMIDSFTTLHGWWATAERTHVSVNLNLTYLKALPEGAEGFVETVLVKRGERLMFLEATIWNPQRTVQYVTATHTKAFVRGIQGNGALRNPSEEEIVAEAARYLEHRTKQPSKL